MGHNLRLTVVMKLKHSSTKNRQISLDFILWTCKIRIECKHFDTCEHKNLTVYNAIQCFVGQINDPGA